MIWISRTVAVVAGAIILAGCEGQEIGGDNLNATQQQEETNQNVATANIPPPPMVTRSASYRCGDGDALYVDILTDENIVNVRDSRTDIPVRLTREAEGEAFEGEGRSLSGRGDEVNYSAPDRPNQTCRAGEA